jgi:hypothetical protein
LFSDGEIELLGCARQVLVWIEKYAAMADDFSES